MSIQYLGDGTGKMQAVFLMFQTAFVSPSVHSDYLMPLLTLTVQVHNQVEELFCMLCGGHQKVRHKVFNKPIYLSRKGGEEMSVMLER
jgi:archaellum component FlaF (FlaF/FlaG flagellin family)